MLSVCAVAIFCLVSVTRSSPLPCEKLVHPLDLSTSSHLEGRWALIAGSLNHPPSMAALAQRDSITMYFSNSSDALTYTQINRFGDECQHRLYNISAEGRAFTFDVGNRFQLTGALLQTSCPDCLVMRWVVSSKRRHSVDLYLLSRRRTVEPKEMEEFRAQLKCYQLPAPVVMDPSRDLCPEQPESQSTAATPQDQEVNSGA